MPRIINDVKLDYKDVLLCPRRNTLKSRAEVDLNVEIKFLYSKRTYKGIPIMAADMDGVGTFEMAKALAKKGLFTTIIKYYTFEEWKRFADENPDCIDHIAVSSGSGAGDLERLTKILDYIPKLSYILLAIANGYTQQFVECVKKVRSTYPNHTIMAGNVATPEMVQELILAGADVAVVGIGSGSVCTTRLKTGVGYPQLSAVVECAIAAHNLNGHIVADGGCTCAGDVAKAFGAGADFVMLGGIFAGHEQGGGKMIEKDGKQYSQFYGMCSATAINKHYGGITSYSTAEGKTVEIPYKGDVGHTVSDILGGLRSACTYVGAESLQELPKRATFVRCTQVVNSIFGES